MIDVSGIQAGKSEASIALNLWYIVFSRKTDISWLAIVLGYIRPTKWTKNDNLSFLNIPLLM